MSNLLFSFNPFVDFEELWHKLRVIDRLFEYNQHLVQMIDLLLDVFLSVGVHKPNDSQKPFVYVLRTDLIDVYLLLYFLSIFIEEKGKTFAFYPTVEASDGSLSVADHKRLK